MAKNLTGVVRRGAAVVGAVLLVVVAAPPASAAVRSSDACTHHWSGPKVCIEIHGEGVILREVVARWTNPPKGAQSATAHMREGSEEYMGTQQAHREGDALVATWRPLRESANRSSETVCVTMDGAEGRWACQDVIAR
ncbi:hypothetical protein ACFVVA_36910 [Kitasatospora sp. NPDC058048]|uniref:hypothetical protein n=1 Tax=Kitasatospora sp. NPDC058048 TaxID=3346313 RepID=UPI0036DBE0EE